MSVEEGHFFKKWAFNREWTPTRLPTLLENSTMRANTSIFVKRGSSLVFVHL